MRVLAQLQVGGGYLYRYISAVDKEFLNVNWSKSVGDNSTPENFLKLEASSWASLWSPQEDHCQTQCQTV